MKHFEQRLVGDRRIRVSSPLTSYPDDFVPSPMAKNYENIEASKPPTLKNKQIKNKKEKAH